MDPEPTPGDPQHASSNSNSNSNSPPPDKDAALKEFLRRPTRGPQPRLTDYPKERPDPAKLAALLSENVRDRLNAMANPVTNPQPPFSTNLVLVDRTKVLPYLLGALGFMFGSGFGVGWLFRGWWGTTATTTTSNPPGTADSSELSKIID